MKLRNVALLVLVCSVGLAGLAVTKATEQDSVTDDISPMNLFCVPDIAGAGCDGDGTTDGPDPVFDSPVELNFTDVRTDGGVVEARLRETGEWVTLGRITNRRTAEFTVYRLPWGMTTPREYVASMAKIGRDAIFREVETGRARERQPDEATIERRVLLAGAKGTAKECAATASDICGGDDNVQNVQWSRKEDGSTSCTGSCSDGGFGVY